MDNNPNRIHFDMTKSNVTERLFFQRLAEIKGIKPEFEFNEPQVTSVVFRGLLVNGIFPIIHYILDIMPYPLMLPDTPGKRALTLSFVEGLLHGFYNYNDFHPMYAKSKFAFDNEAPSLIDLAIGASAEAKSTSIDRWASSLISDIDQHINSLVWEEAVI